MGSIFSVPDLSSAELAPSTTPNATSSDPAQNATSGSSSVALAVTTSPVIPSISSRPINTAKTHNDTVSASKVTMSSAPVSSVKPAASSGGPAIGSPSSRPSGSPSQNNASNIKATGSGKPASSGKPTAVKPTGAPANAPTHSFTATSTITDWPETTLSQPSFVPVTENGRVSQSAPAFFTVLSTSTEPDGGLVTFTHIIANPDQTGFAGSQALAGHASSFFDNSGAVAGVFLVVGSILTGAVVFGLFLLCRKQRHKREEHRRWLVSMHRPRPLSDNDPFMTERSFEQFDAPWDGRVRSPGGDAPVGPGHYKIAPPRRVQPNYNISEPIPIRPTSIPGPLYDVTPAAVPSGFNAIGLAITTDEDNKPSAQSSPSIYPASVPPTAEDDLDIEPIALPPPPPPPRPRRSHLRSPSLTKTTQLVTPPASDASHSPVSVSDVLNPFTAPSEHEHSAHYNGVQLNEILGRRTLLDVRPRSQNSTDVPRF